MDNEFPCTVLMESRGDAVKENNSQHPLMSLFVVHCFKCNTNVNSFPPQHRTKKQVLLSPLTETEVKYRELRNLPNRGSGWN